MGPQTRSNSIRHGASNQILAPILTGGRGLVHGEPARITAGETTVSSYIAETKQNLRELIDFLISHNRKINVQIEGNRALYNSKIVRADYGDPFSKMSEESKLIIAKLDPDTGNALLKLSPNIGVQFLLEEISCQFDAKYLGESTEYPHILKLFLYYQREQKKP
jgi:hypothetical protein